MNIHNRIKKFQFERNWSLNHMALEAGISPGTALNWFKRKSTPTIDAIQSLCNAFGITLSEFFNETDEEYVYLSKTQQEYLNEFDLLDPREKEDILRLIKTRNEIRKNNPI